MQNQESFTNLTLDGAKVSLASAGTGLKWKKKTPNNIFFDHLEKIKSLLKTVKVKSNPQND